MNQKLLIGLILLLVGGLGAAYMVMGKQTAISPATGGTVFGSIKDALSKSLSLECMYTEDGRQTKAYIKNGAVRSDFTGKTADESGSVIMKDQKIYFWNAQGGFMMQVPEVTPGAGGEKAKEAPTGVGDVVESIEKYKESCKPAVVNDTLFTPPANVTFQDFSKMMQQTAPGSTGSVAVPTIDYSQFLPEGEKPPTE